MGKKESIQAGSLPGLVEVSNGDKSVLNVLCHNFSKNSNKDCAFSLKGQSEVTYVLARGNAQSNPPLVNRKNS